ncbi:ATP synthase subunit C lysine N-methyltransferase isoform X3 [Callorhinus ursinus]|uniref:Protein N-lysine methyltransferase FAM173B isoform X2 n=1 Tax=Callorhinus ursinus TaxID=34884 RepID=A0A3Q7NNM7_CALUR|nr:protein N-lysine methyltransferase FAM173B isoform X2 [Callorhinus ursinus]
MEGGGGAPPEVLEESHSGCVLPTSLGTNSLKKSSWGFLFTGIIGGTLVAVYAVATPFLMPALRKICLPFVPATTKQIENVVKMLHCRRGSLVDIGSGDGRIVTFSQYSNVIIFGVPQMMPQLEEKLMLELKDDARVIACRFPFPRWTPDHITGEGMDAVWAYDVSTVRGKGPRRPVRFQPVIQM